MLPFDDQSTWLDYINKLKKMEKGDFLNDKYDDYDYCDCGYGCWNAAPSS